MKSTRRAWAATCVILVACGGTVGSGGGSADGGADGGAGGAAGFDGGGGTAGHGTGVGSPYGVPAPDPGAGPGDGPGVTMVVRRWSLGDVDAQGNASSSAWKTLGFNLDGKASTSKSTDVCKPAGNGTASVHDNGAGGIDNSFGSNILPIVTGLISNPSDEINAAIASGETTLMLRLDGLGAQASYAGLGGGILRTGQSGSAPSWDGSDVWPVLCESLVGCGTGAASPSNPITKLSAAWVTQRLWISGPPTDVAIPLSLLGSTSRQWPLHVHRAVLVMRLSADGRTATHGVLGGVLDTAEFVQDFQRGIEAIQPSLCGSQTVQSILPTLIGASDILVDGTQDPSRTCDAISIGLGFEAVAASFGPVTPPETPTSPCQP